LKNQVELNGDEFITCDFTTFSLPLETTHVKKANFDTSMTSKAYIIISIIIFAHAYYISA
jgi:hypothetical protein